jgi:hypothetical protein
MINYNLITSIYKTINLVFINILKYSFKKYIIRKIRISYQT